jgi:ppGpp synthetase/RelA/SpoT-type nucleotidyltranferase/Tfp pilus assembly protein PilF
MTDKTRLTDSEWVAQQVPRFEEVLPHYKTYAGVLTGLLQLGVRKVAPHSIVQARAKAPPSFAEKILRKRNQYTDPLNDMTDLCGARVITHTAAEVQQVAEFIEQRFVIDWDNSEDASSRMQTSEFGYRSVHYIVSIDPEQFPDEEIPEELIGLKAEIQVRTILEHAWADIGHDVTYKSPFKIPEHFKRRIAAQAATLEAADREFGRIIDDLGVYGAHFGDALSVERVQQEIHRQGIVLAKCGRDPDVAARIARMANRIGDWALARDTADDYIEEDNRAIHRELGKALIKLSTRRTPERAQAIAHLEIAAAKPEPDLEALLALGEAWREEDNWERARDAYRGAFNLDATRPDVLCQYLLFEIDERRDPHVAKLTAPVIRDALVRCRKQIEAEVNVPASFWHTALFQLLLGQHTEALSSLSRAIALDPGKHVLCEARESLRRLSRYHREFAGMDHLDTLLLLALAVRYHSTDACDELQRRASPGLETPRQPVIILAGGCAAEVQERMESYRPLLLEAFRGFEGTLLGGGTLQGIAGLAGDISQHYGEAIYSVGYLPRNIPTDAKVDRDTSRYSTVRHTQGEKFSALEPLQSWIDLVAKGVDPKDVRLLGVNGGLVAAAEYRMALALGARVALLESSGREAARLAQDPDWAGTPELMAMPEDRSTLNVFLVPGVQPFEASHRDTLAQAIHDTFREEKRNELAKEYASAQPWEGLGETYRNANRSQADHIAAKLALVGCRIVPAEEAGDQPFQFEHEEIERLAELEHGRWNVERMLDGWRYGEVRDNEAKLHPSLVAWKDLSDAVREWDYRAVRSIPELLAKVGLGIVRG